MKASTIKRICVTFIVNHVLAGTFAFKWKRKLLCSIGYEIGENTKIVGPVFNTGRLKIGSNCWIGKNLVINGNGDVTIGNNCDLAPEITFLTGGHEIGSEMRRAGQGLNYSIVVGDGVWIGARSTILGNITIGKGAVITACACVAHSIDENVLAGGVPARRIKELNRDASETISE